MSRWPELVEGELAPITRTAIHNIVFCLEFRLFPSDRETQKAGKCIRNTATVFDCQVICKRKNAKKKTEMTQISCWNIIY